MSCAHTFAVSRHSFSNYGVRCASDALAAHTAFSHLNSSNKHKYQPSPITQPWVHKTKWHFLRQTREVDVEGDGDGRKKIKKSEIIRSGFECWVFDTQTDWLTANDNNLTHSLRALPTFVYFHNKITQFDTLNENRNENHNFGWFSHSSVSLFIFIRVRESEKIITIFHFPFPCVH